MSYHDAHAAACDARAPEDAVLLVIRSRTTNLGEFSVGRVLPTIRHKSVGPFLFFDHIGPAVLPPGVGINVRPHPHINLATLTYLFEGEIEHRDSLGSFQPIRPREVNWMVAGRGITHSERSSAEQTAMAAPIEGIQVWVGLPSSHAEVAPSFSHHSGEQIPEQTPPGARLTLVAGRAYGMSSPVNTLSPLFYVDAQLEAGAELALPLEYAERAAYVVKGEVVSCGHAAVGGEMLVFARDREVVLKATSRARLILLGGEPLDGKRLLWWNFVYSDAERLEQAKRDWREGRFPKVPGDDQEFIPLPDR